MTALFKHGRNRAGAGHIQCALFTVAAVLATAISPNVFAETYDVVINNGRVMDPETIFGVVDPE